MLFWWGGRSAPRRCAPRWPRPARASVSAGVGSAVVLYTIPKAAWAALQTRAQTEGCELFVCVCARGARHRQTAPKTHLRLRSGQFALLRGTGRLQGWLVGQRKVLAGGALV